MIKIKGDNKMDQRCICCRMMYERFYDSNLYRLGSISDDDYRQSLFRKLSNLLRIEEAGNYYFFDSICTSLLSTGKIKEIMKEDDLNIRNEHIIQKTLTIYLKFYQIIKNETYFISSSFWYKNGKYYGQSLNPTLNKFLSMVSKNKNPEDRVYELDMEKLQENASEVWDLIKKLLNN
jgi:hypothetical protein